MVEVIDGCKIVINPLCPLGQAFIIDPKYFPVPGANPNNPVIIVSCELDKEKLLEMVGVVKEKINELKMLRNVEKI